MIRRREEAIQVAMLTAVPIQLSFEAARHVAGLGLWTEFEAMIEHTSLVVPEARAITIRLDRPDQHGEPVVWIQAEIDGPGPLDERIESRWDRWIVETYPPDVTRHFGMIARQGRGHDGR